MLVAGNWFAQLLHPGRVSQGGGYWFWSGIGSDFGEITLLALFFSIVAWFRLHNCHVKGCWRLQWHEHPVHGHPVCKHHHPHDPTDLGREARGGTST